MAALLSISAAATPASAACDKASDGLGVSRIVEIDTSAGPLYGDMTKFVKEDSFLGPKEVVLTFDDGPIPWITKSILDTLDTYCTKATFFSVGKMALAYPATVKEVMARGHTLGTHTWSHPLNLKRLSFAKAKDQIDRGFAAVSLAAGQPIAPFFRFPGLNDSNDLLAHLQSRGVAAFTVDVVSNDSYIGNTQRLIDRVLSHTQARNGGILLFHDIKAATAKALPAILAGLKSRGFKVVHMRAKAPMAAIAGYEEELRPALAKTQAASETHQLIPFTGMRPETSAAADGATGNPAENPGGAAETVTELAPAPRQRVSTESATGEAGATSQTERPVKASGSSRSQRSKSGRAGKKKRAPQEAYLLEF